MEMNLPPGVQEGLDAARRTAQRSSARLTAVAQGRSVRVLRAWPGGFAVDAAEAVHLRGLIDLYDGTCHLSQCLIVAASEEAGEWHFECKRMTAAATGPSADFVRADNAPVALLANKGSPERPTE